MPVITRRSVQQVASLPFVTTGAAIEVLLITSRRRGRWIVPKGSPTKGRSLPQAAAHEAYEEAGVIGPVQPEPVGRYRYTKTMPTGYGVPCEVFVYPLLVRQHLLDWTERAERTLRWAVLDDAAELVDDRDLGRLLAALAAAGGAPLQAFLDDPAAAASDAASSFPSH